MLPRLVITSKFHAYVLSPSPLAFNLTTCRAAHPPLRIHDLRGREDDFSLDRNGFAVIRDHMPAFDISTKETVTPRQVFLTPRHLQPGRDGPHSWATSQFCCLCANCSICVPCIHGFDNNFSYTSIENKGISDQSTLDDPSETDQPFQGSAVAFRVLTLATLQLKLAARRVQPCKTPSRHPNARRQAQFNPRSAPRFFNIANPATTSPDLDLPRIARMRQAAHIHRRT